MIDPARPDYQNTPISDSRPVFGYLPSDAFAAPCVSIVTPFFNTGPIFNETARSVLQQSLQQWEWTIVNDGSTDAAALRLLAEYRQRDPRIRVVDLPANRGLSAARNAGFAASRTPYVFQLDSDDLLEPTAVEKCWWFLESSPEYAFVKGYTVGFGSQEYLSTHGFHDGPLFLDQNPVDATAMIRTAVHSAVGGYDESNRGGLEDWEFWLSCAHAGYWGATIPDYLDWYRRRLDHGHSWANWDGSTGQAGFANRIRERYGSLWNDSGFPVVTPKHHMPNASVPDQLPGVNRLTKAAPRILMILPWLTVGGADKVNLDIVQQLRARGWEVTIATTLSGDHSWLPLFSRVTPDVFAMHRFIRPLDYPRFLKYLIGSRQPDIVFVSNSELGYMLLPYLRANAPESTYVDFTHMEEEHWKSGGYPRQAIVYQECLDLNITLSEHLKAWMVARGADPERTLACHTGVAAPPLDHVAAARERTRRRLAISDDLPVILYAGRICDQKQPQVFAETMLELANNDVEFLTIVAGSGPDLPMLERFVEQHGLKSRIRLAGSVSPGEISDLMAAADIFFLPSKWEGIALTFLEAMAHGRVVVGADVGGQRELVTSECGVLVRPGADGTQAQHYAAVLTELLRDGRRRRDMGTRSRRRIEAEFEVTHMIDRLLSAFSVAERFRRSEPRVAAPQSVARVCANHAVEYMRLYHLADELWSRLLPGAPTSPENTRPSRSWQARLLRGFSALEPVYAWGMRRGWTWLSPLRRRLRSAVLGS